MRIDRLYTFVLNVKNVFDFSYQYLQINLIASLVVLRVFVITQPIFALVKDS